MAPVAKGQIPRVPAAADIDGRASTQAEGRAFPVAQGYFAFDVQRTVGNYRDFRHVPLLSCDFSVRAAPGRAFNPM
jgi:hypothetical protein